MRICGIELKSNNCIMTLIEFENNNILDVDLTIKKIILFDDEKRDSILNFYKEITTFIKENKIEKIVIKKRAKKGNFAGGAVTFKMEALIQSILNIEVDLISSQSISSYDKKNHITFPTFLKKYQEQAYLTILTSLK